MPDINETRRVEIFNSYHELSHRDYFGSAIKVLKRHGIRINRGFDVILQGNIPVNSGASSSSAMIAAWIFLLLEIFDEKDSVDPQYVGQLAYEAEVLEHGEPGGMMDQYTVSMGGVLHIRSQPEFQVTRLKNGLKGMILANSGTPKETLGLLARVRGNVERAVSIVSQHEPGFRLSEIQPDQIESYLPDLPDELQPYFSAAVRNHDYTNQAIKEFLKQELDLSRIGSIMNDHHAVLRDNLRITTDRIDMMISTALDAGACGAKINGSGGGGSIVILAPGCEDKVLSALQQQNVEAFPVCVAGGVELQ